MPVDFTNVFYDNIMESLATVINGEFSTPVHYDEHRGNQSFLLTPTSDEFVTFLSTGQQREYNVEISYQLKIGGQYNKLNMKQIAQVMERLKKLIYENKIYSNGSVWFDAHITTIEYVRDEDDDTILRGVANFNCNSIEVIT